MTIVVEANLGLFTPFNMGLFVFTFGDLRQLLSAGFGDVVVILGLEGFRVNPSLGEAWMARANACRWKYPVPPLWFCERPGDGALVFDVWVVMEAGPKRGPVRRLASEEGTVYIEEDDDGIRGDECKTGECGMTGECMTGELAVVGGGNEAIKACFAAEEAVGVRARENMMKRAIQLLNSRWK
jgi:hypothetical protein